MSKSDNSASSRSKYLSLIRQTTGIELDICPPEEFNSNQKPIRQTSAGDHIFIKNEHLNIVQRAQRREQLTKSRQQNNLEQIFSLALEYVNHEAQFEKLDLDWLMKFTELALRIYSTTMQELWAKILAVELSQAGTFSYKTLKALSEINNKEAMIFYKAVKIMTRLGDERSGRILSGVYKKPTFMSLLTNNSRTAVNLGKFGLSYPQLMTLADIGLLYNQEIEAAPFQAKEPVNLNFHGKNIVLRANHKDVIITYYKFTQTGYELSKLISVEPDEKYLRALLDEFSSLINSTGSIDQSV